MKSTTLTHRQQLNALESANGYAPSVEQFASQVEQCEGTARNYIRSAQWNLALGKMALRGARFRLNGNVVECVNPEVLTKAQRENLEILAGVQGLRNGRYFLEGLPAECSPAVRWAKNCRAKTRLQHSTRPTHFDLFPSA